MSCKATQYKRIKSIRITKKTKEMFDLVVPNTNNFFLANGILTHNTGKSWLMKKSLALSPLWSWTTGRGMTGVGLVASVTKDEYGAFTLQVGPLVMADNGMIGIDEMEKMDKSDYGMLNNAMAEEQTKITKAGVDQTLRVRTSILATSNPLHRKFNDRDTIIRQLAPIPKDILDRFDIIWAMREEIDPSKLDEKFMARHVQDENKTNSIWDFEQMRYYSFAI